MTTLGKKDGDGYTGGEVGLIKTENEEGLNEREYLFPGSIICRLTLLSDSVTPLIK